jgi:tetratricopeptide (TPR) repeat protein
VIEDVRRLERAPPGRGSARATSSAFGTDPGSRAHYERVAAAFAGVAEGLDLAHQAGVVHRDVKPSNLILDAEGRLRLTDFGLARVEGEAAAMTLTGEVVGTPAYMSPEQVRAPPDGIDARTDVYSLGATLYEALTLRAPFHEAAPVEIFSMVVSKNPTPLRGIDSRIPRDLATIVEKAMEKDRARRYADAGEMARDLRFFAEGAAIRAKHIGPLGRAWRTAKRHKALTSLAAAVVILAAVGAAAAVRALRAELAWNELEYAALCIKAEDEVARGSEMGSGPWVLVGGEHAARARAFLDRAIDVDPDRPDAYFGRALLPDAQIGARLDDLDAARARGLGETTYHLSRALIFQTTGHGEQSDDEERVADTVQEASKSEDFYFRARIAMSRGARGEAIEAFTAALQSAPAESFVRRMSLFGRALARETEADLLGAIEDLAALVQSGAAQPGVRVRLASLWRRAGHLDRAEQTFRETLEETRGRNSALAFRELSSACQACREVEWEERVSEAAVRSFGSDVDVWIARSAVLWAVNRTEEGLEAADRAVALAPADARAHLERGRRLATLARLERAVEAFETALALSPGSVDACGGLAEALFRLNRRDDAVAAWDPALAAARDDPRVHNACGLFLCDRVHEFDRAVDELRAAIALDKDDDNSFHFNLGKALASRGDRVEAAAEFRHVVARLREAIARQPGVSTTHRRLGVTLLRLHGVDESVDLDEARAQYRKAIQLDPRLAEHFETALVYLAGGDIQACYRYNDACSSLYRGRGRGNDAPPDESARAPLRAHAYEWLRGELASWRRQVEAGDAIARGATRSTIARLKKDGDFDLERQEAELPKLPEAEGAEWRELWAQVVALQDLVRN